VQKENSLSISKRRVLEEDNHRVVKHSVKKKMLSKVCFEREVSRRAQEPFKGRRRVDTLRRLSKPKISKEIELEEIQMRPKKSGS
jgi:hypothetical protein